MSKETENKNLKICNGGVSDEQIAAWKKQHRKVYSVEVPDPDTGETFVGYFHHPDMETMSLVNKIAKADEVKSSTTLFDKCWLGGDNTMKEDALVRIAATAQLDVIFRRYAGTLKNL